MSTKPRTGLNNPDTAATLAERLADRLTRSFTVGEDTEGYSHHYYRPADCVVRYDPDSREVERVTHLNGRLLETYVAWVHSEIDWVCKGPHARRGIAADRERKEGE